MGIHVKTRYLAEFPVRDQELLESLVTSRIESYIATIEDPQVYDCDLTVNVQTFEIDGKVSMTLVGQVNRQPIDELVLSGHQRPRISSVNTANMSSRARREYRRNNGVELLAVWFLKELVFAGFRSAFPSDTARAIGPNQFIGELLKSLDASTAEVCHRIDQKVGRPLTDGPQILRTAIVLSSVSLVIAFIVSGVLFAVIKSDPTIPIFGTLLVGAGLAAGVLGTGFLKLPHRYLATEPAGRTFLKKSGLRKRGILRAFAVSMMLFALFLLAGGAFLLITGGKIAS